MGRDLPVEKNRKKICMTKVKVIFIPHLREKKSRSSGIQFCDGLKKRLHVQLEILMQS